MSLKQWLELKLLRPEPTSPDEIKGLLGIVSTRLDDSRVEASSADTRFEAAYRSALTSATIALRASGYRTVGSGHHVKTFESLALTIEASDKTARKLKTFNNRRTQSNYDVSGVVSSQDLAEMIKLAAKLQED